VRVMGLEIAMLDAAAAAGATAMVASDTGRSLSIDAATLHAQRSAAQRDVVAIGLLMHRLLAGEPALGEADIGRAIELMPPLGRELVRLPWDVPLPVPDSLRTVNSAQVQGTQVSGNGPVLTIRRAIAMIGLDGMERAVTALRPWPGPLDERSAEALQAMLERVKGVGLLAQALRPAGYDGEVVLLVALLQNLGRLLVQYHFPDEAAQIRRLMQPV